MAISANEFHGLARGMMRKKLNSTKPSIKMPRNKKVKTKLQDPGPYPPDYPQRRSNV